MRQQNLAVLVCLIGCAQAWAATPIVSQSFPAYNSTNWQLNGTVSESVYGLGSGVSGTGSLIYKHALPNEYEVRTRYSINATGGSFVTYFRATQDAQLTLVGGVATPGTFYALELNDPQGSNGNYSCVLALWKNQNNEITLKASTTIACYNNMVLRVAVRNTFIFVHRDEPSPYLLYTSDMSIVSGSVGVGARITPAGNAISQVEVYPADNLAPTQMPVPAVAAFDNKIEMQWPAVADDNGGSGLYIYQVHRWENNTWVWKANVWRPGWIDVDVQPGASYTYHFRAIDYHLNYSPDRVFMVQAAPAGSSDPRQIGLRSTGTYWGGAGEQIDVMSGNLNFTVPILKAEARGGWGATFALNYNSQIWGRDGDADCDPDPVAQKPCTWKYGGDVGYGFGWKLLAGSITPIYQTFYVINHYRYTDSSGAEYRLDQNSNGVWTSKDGVYVSYEAASKKLWFNDGSFWLMNVESSGTEDDGGTFYPSLMQDSNGNQIKIRYKQGINWWAPNSSARIDEIEDVKASATGGGAYHTYKFYWTTDPLPHLDHISLALGGAWGRSFTYGNRALSSPWGEAAGNTKVLESTTNVATGRPHSMVYTTAGELHQVVYPYGGMLQWDFRDFTYNGSRTIREVEYRRMRKATTGNPETVHAFGHDDANDANRSYHAMSFINISGLPGDKVWYFNTDRRLSLHHERAAGAVIKVQREYAWAYSNPGNSGPYISQVTTTIEPGPNQLVSRVQQTLDGYGNLTQMKQYDFGLAEVDARTYTNTYLTDANWTSRYIRNRLKLSTLTKGAYSAELARNYYDHEPRPTCTGYSLQTIPGNNQRQHDSATYTNTYYYRGNARSVARPGYAGCINYDVTGTVRNKSDNAGTTTIQTQSSTNYAAPSQITANGFTTSMNWTSLLQLDTQTGLNGEVVNFDYNANGDLSETTTPYGLKTTHVLSTTTNLLTTTTGMPTVPGQPAKPKRWTKKYLDGFGRAVKVETGYTNTGGVETKLSTVDTEYEACACTPMGKVKRVSQPYASGSPLWTVYAYDELGRVTSVTPPANTGTGSGAPTTYTYAVNKVTVTEPQTTRWKRYTMDAFGNLAWVNEPKQGGGEYATLYQYTPMNQLQSVTMVRNGYKNNTVGNYTQVRTFNWGTDGRLYSTTFPENGTTIYSYTANGQLYEKVDAKQQKIRHEYDDKRRLTVVRKYPIASGSEDAAQRVTYHYDTNPFGGSLNTTGRLAAVEYGTNLALGALRESYTYDIPGSMTLKRLGQYDPGTTLWKLDAVYTYDEEGRPKTLKYPNNGHTYTYNYDAGSRPTTMTHEEAGSTVTDATVGGFNAAGQMTAFNFLYEGANFANTFGFNNLNQLTGIGITRGVQNYAGFAYNYHTSQNNGRVQNMVRQMWNTAGTQVVNETVTYGYDTLGRLSSTTATTGISGQAWSQTFSYDGFGNLYNTGGAGLAAPFNLNSQTSLNSEKNQLGAHDANGNLAGLTYDVDNRLKAQGLYTFGYAPDNKRVVRSKDIGGQWEHEVAFYSGSRRLGRYRVTPGGSWMVETIHEERYFAGRALMPQDRLGSAAHAWLLPYGQELTNGQNPTEPNDRVKFATYTRDQGGWYDYADQRYYGNARFITADPYMASGGTGSPSSWNRYAYVSADPVNKTDRRGLLEEGPGLPPEDPTPRPPRDPDIPEFPFPTEGERSPCYDFESCTLVANERFTKLINDLRARTASAITNLNERCQQAIGATRLNDAARAASAMLFLDARDPYLGNVTQHMVVGNGVTATLRETVGEDAAAVLSDRSGTPTRYTVMGSAFFGATASEQNVILVHEAFHVGLRIADIDLANALRIRHDGTLEGASQAISNYFYSDCDPRLLQN